jgi:hypothetical protein
MPAFAGMTTGVENWPLTSQLAENQRFMAMAGEPRAGAGVDPLQIVGLAGEVSICVASWA